MNDPHTVSTLRPGSGRVVVLVGHGGVPRDFPRHKVSRLRALEGERQARGLAMTDEERALDEELRHFPRTPRTDPYKAGLECLASALQEQLTGHHLVLAYNEFCAPSVPDAVHDAVAAGATDVVLISSMMTPGGSHAEVEIPELVEQLVRAHPGVSIRYAWPFDVREVAMLMAAQVDRFADSVAGATSRQALSVGRRGQ